MAIRRRVIPLEETTPRVLTILTRPERARSTAMNRIGWAMSILAAALALVSQVAPAAAARRTYVAPSPTGDDRNPRTRQDPGESLAHALTQTDHDGEVTILEPGGFGPVTIDKSVTIDGGGYHGEILSTGTWAIKIEAGKTDKITLRNLFLDGGA